ncbi:MAG: hypothetical protein NVSMB21_16560 [Vulcanimicrobiaceae bacterium]
MARHALVVGRALASVALASAALASVALPLAFASVARAQSLTTLHVRRFTMRAEPASVRVGETFRLTIAAHVDEELFELDNVTLPDLTGFDVLGDERRCHASSRGSDCTEILTVSPTVAGDRTIAAAVMDAVDGRNARPSRFSTNTVALRVGPAPARVPAWLVEVVWAIALAALPLLLACLVVYALLRRFGRRPPAERQQPLSVTPAPPSASDLDARLRALVRDLAARPSRERARAVRAALRERAGARDRETLGDLTRREGFALSPQLLVALRAIERPAFCAEHDVVRAVEEALPSLRF